jgi:hypothetical protein
MGTGIIFHKYKPGAIQAKESYPGSIAIDTLIKYHFTEAKETDTYIEDDIRISSKLKIKHRITFYHVYGK